MCIRDRDTKLKTANIPCYFVKSSRKTGEKPSGENTAGRENPLLTGNIRNQLIRLAVPLLLGNILQQCYHIVDSLMIGRFVGLEAFAAIGVAGTVMNLLIFVMEGFCTGLSVVFSMYYGSGAGKLPTASAVVGDMIACLLYTSS